MREQGKEYETYGLRRSGGSYIVTLPQEFGRRMESAGIEELKVDDNGEQVVIKPKGATDKLRTSH